MPRARLVMIGAMVAICGIFSGDAGALTPEQCTFFAVEDRTPICHATGADERPFILINAWEAACAIAHAQHENDFVAVNGTCSAPAPLPQGAPCDATLACADGLSCTAGYCSPSGNP